MLPNIAIESAGKPIIVLSTYGYGTGPRTWQQGALSSSPPSSSSTSSSPMGMEEGHGGGSRVQGDEGGRQGAGQAPGQEALTWDHLENID